MLFLTVVFFSYSLVNLFKKNFLFYEPLSHMVFLAIDVDNMTDDELKKTSGLIFKITFKAIVTISIMFIAQVVSIIYLIKALKYGYMGITACYLAWNILISAIFIFKIAIKIKDITSLNLLKWLTIHSKFDIFKNIISLAYYSYMLYILGGIYLCTK